MLLVLNAEGTFERTVTDGDIRRLLLQGCNMQDSLASLAKIESIVLRDGYTQKEALALMNEKAINHLPVLDGEGLVIKVLERKELDEQILLSTPHMGSWEREFVDEAFKTNWIAPLGPNVDAFEREVADHVGVRHAAALASGTAAIHLALVILGVQRGDTVFCASLTFSASANPIAYQGAEPVFIDSEPDSWNMSPVALEKAFAHAAKAGKMPKAVIVVNLYGQSADMDPIMELCNRYGVPMVEDAAESLGARYKGRASGSFGVMGIYSFNGNKIITTSGGGMLVSDNEDYIRQARFLSTQARDPAPHYEHTRIGYNYRMSNILAGVGRGQIRVLDERVASRRRVYDRYRQGLADCPQLQWMPEPQWSYSTHWLTACTVDPARSALTSSEVIGKLAGDHIEARPVWKPMHMQPVFSQCLSFDHGDRSVSADLFANGICLPSGSNMADAQQDRIIESIRTILG
ncbi:aminotransferase class I/II-fold pyridoxal phosphate-dependent enzyme [Janthinobacterium sp. 17J80-10]|nr:aminotransferase class I/II-fold pyridoxal phosphate-dependent enzyme [Janthinobacterium sp. 17J80-10]